MNPAIGTRRAFRWQDFCVVGVGREIKPRHWRMVAQWRKLLLTHLRSFDWKCYLELAACAEGVISSP